MANSSRIAGARRCGRTSAESTATISSARSTGAPFAAGDPIEAIKQATLIEEKELSANWHAAIREQYAPVMQVTARAHTFGRSLTSSDKSQMATNVSPSISPDGRHIVFFSSRDLFSIDLYLADAITGRIVRKLFDTALNSHFTSLQFIGSAGSWSPDSRQFVLGGVHAGKAVLAILNIANGGVVREIEVPEAGEILNPTWSPDRKSIAFSATVGGDSDLFIHDLASGTNKRVTTDLFADLQPAWSPDGTASRSSRIVSRRTQSCSMRAITGWRSMTWHPGASNRWRPSQAARTSTRSGTPTAGACSSFRIRAASAMSTR